MKIYRNIIANAIPPSRVIALVILALTMCACGKIDNTVAEAQTRIFNALKSQGIYEKGNLPDDPPPTPEQIKGRFDIVGGAYRHIVNEETNANRGNARDYEISRDDSIAFMFDARIFTGGEFDRQQTFYTNIASRIRELTGNNEDFGGWSTAPLKIKVGDDARILKSLQEALISCRAGDGDPSNDDEEDGIASDQVRVYLTSDIAFGDRMVYSVPPGSTIVYEVTDIEIIK